MLSAITEESSTDNHDVVEIREEGEAEEDEVQEVDEEWLRELTIKLAGYGVDISYEIFKKALGVKDDYVARRVFAQFDLDDDGMVGLTTLIKGLQALLNGPAENKIRFLFSLYDDDGDGNLTVPEMEAAIASSIKESKADMKNHNAESLAAILMQKLDPEGTGVVSIDTLSKFCKEQGLEKELFSSIAAGLLARERANIAAPSPRRQELLIYLRNHLSIILFCTVYFAVIFILFVTKAYSHRDDNWFVILAKGNGQVLNFISVFILVFVLRRTLTYFRQTTIGSFFPIDQHIDLHKLTGYIIFICATWHTVMHLCNIGVNMTAATNLTYAEVLLTTRANIGWVYGLAPLTGVLLCLVFIAMFVCAMNCVRSKGHFEVFWWTHQLYYVYYILLVLHGPIFWRFLILPLAVFLLERILRSRLLHLARFGTTRVREGIPLPSRVTHLIIERPPGFTYRPGDYVFVNIPKIARWEWHPFTISSAPENETSLWLHVRAVGGWTNKLYDYFEAQAETRDKQIYKKSIKIKKQMSISSGNGVVQYKGMLNSRHNAASATNGSLVTSNSVTSERPVLPRTSLTIEDRLLSRERTLSVLQREVKRRTTIRRSVSPSSIPGLKHLRVTGSGAGETTRRFNSERGTKLVLPASLRGESSAASSVRLKSLKKKQPSEDYTARYRPRTASWAGLAALDTTAPPSVPAVSPTPPTAQDTVPPTSGDDVTVSVPEEPMSPTPEREIEVIREEEDGEEEEERGKEEEGDLTVEDIVSTTTTILEHKGHIGSPAKPLQIYVNGPYGAPSEEIFRAEHAILVAGGIGVTPFASILQSIMYRFLQSKVSCPGCQNTFVPRQMVKLIALKKVDFYWINRDRRAFEWFLELLSQLELEQEQVFQASGTQERIIDYHLYMTQGPKSGNLKSMGLTMAERVVRELEQRDIFTGLTAQTNIGRPNWTEIFHNISDSKKGKVTVFFCGPARLGADLRRMCDLYGFQFRQEVF